MRLTQARVGRPGTARRGAKRRAFTRMGKTREARRALQVTAAGEDLLQAAAPSDQRTRLGLGDAATANQSTIVDAAVALSGVGWSGSLSGSGVATLQELADWIDANLSP